MQQMSQTKVFNLTTTVYLKNLLAQLQAIYRNKSELKIIKVCLDQIQEKKHLEDEEISCINLLFNRFIMNIKKNSAMEAFFCYSEFDEFGEFEKARENIMSENLMKKSNGVIHVVKRKKVISKKTKIRK